MRLSKAFIFLKNGLAMLLAFGRAIPGCHGHAQGVHFTQERQGALRHAAEQSLFADALRGLHQGPCGVTQQHPIDGMMDVGFQASAVEEHCSKVDLRLQAKLPLSRFGMK
jgi:hypothetical protein